MVHLKQSPEILLLVLHKQGCVVLTQIQTNTNPASFSTSQKRRLRLQFAFLVTTMFASDGVLDPSVLVTATQESRDIVTCRRRKHSSSFIRTALLASPEGVLRASLTPPLKSSLFYQQPALRELAACLPGICRLPPLLELPHRNTQSPVQKPLTAQNISNYNSYCIHLMTVCLHNFIRSWAYFMQRAASC